MSALDRYEVRRFDPGRDLEAACRCYKSGFYHNSWPIIDHAEHSLLEDLILVTHRICDATFVAEVDGEARGILAGYFSGEPKSLLRALVLQAIFNARVLLRRYRMTPFARAAWWRSAYGILTYLVRHPVSPSETILLTSQKEYRGGIGRVLMDAWVAETLSRGYTHMTVCTDSTVSWDFYERYGFVRVRDFPLKSFFHSLPGVDVRGYIYSLDIDGRPGGGEGIGP